MTESIAEEHSQPGCWQRFVNWLYLTDASVDTSGKPRFDALEATRWIASCHIVAYHFYGQQLQLAGFLMFGGHWVQYFFMLSGFLLAYSEMTKPLKRRDPAQENKGITYAEM